MAKKPTLAEKAETLPNAEHDKEIRDRERRIDGLNEQLRKAHVRIRIAEQELKESEERVEFCEHFQKMPRLASVTKPNKGSRSAASAVICFNDWHLEERVDSKTVNGLNEFNLDIASARVRKSTESAVELLEIEQQISNIQEIVVGFLGDHITGYIHPELIENNYLSPTEASLLAFEHFHWILKYLQTNTNLPIRVVTSNGNHGRTTDRMRISSSHRNSYEWLVYQQCSKYYTDNPRVYWQIAESYHNYLEVQGKTIRFHHGDSIRYQGGVGGITIPVIKAIAQWNLGKRADCDVFGHWHSPLFHRKFISSNCLIGHGPYAISIKADFSEPSQTLLVFDKKRPSWVSAREIYCN